MGRFLMRYGKRRLTSSACLAHPLGTGLSFSFQIRSVRITHWSIPPTCILLSHRFRTLFITLSYHISRSLLHIRNIVGLHRLSPSLPKPRSRPGQAHRQARKTLPLAALTRQRSFSQNETPPDHLLRRASRLCSGWQAMGHWYWRPHRWCSAHEHRMDDRRRAHLHHLLPVSHYLGVEQCDLHCHFCHDHHLALPMYSVGLHSSTHHHHLHLHDRGAL
ncbi:hypothetical protein FJTKL_03144 [Diaporthe vaccinii]|uniref:Uncharacterized protein n=1 Tax=Diaporthe vaccinii TaxID=105482 RepID=A0ABR4DW37_9PEZI